MYLRLRKERPKERFFICHFTLRMSAVAWADQGQKPRAPRSFYASYIGGETQGLVVSSAITFLAA